MLRGIRYFLSDLVFWFRSHPIRGLITVVLAGAAIAGAVIGIA